MIFKVPSNLSYPMSLCMLISAAGRGLSQSLSKVTSLCSPAGAETALCCLLDVLSTSALMAASREKVLDLETLLSSEKRLEEAWKIHLKPCRKHFFSLLVCFSFPKLVLRVKKVLDVRLREDGTRKEQEDRIEYVKREVGGKAAASEMR